MNSTATAVAFRGRSGPRVGDSQRVSQAALQAELVRGAMVRNTQSISPMPDPLPPADPLGLAGLAAIGLAIVVGELAKQFNELARLANEWNWGLRNPNREVALPFNTSTPVETMLKYAPGTAVSYYGMHEGSAFPDSTGSTYRTNTWINEPHNNSWGQPYTDRAPELFFHTADSIYLPYPGIQQFPAVRWFDPRNGTTKISRFTTNYMTGNRKITIRPISGDSSTWLDFPGGATVAGLNLPPLPQVQPAELPSVPVLEPRPVVKPPEVLPEVVPVVPVVTPSPALVTTAQVTRTNFYMPDRLPAPLAPPATKTRTTTGAGTVVAPAALPIPQTSTDQRVYGSQVITSIGVRPDVVAIAEEVGRMEQKLGRLLMSQDPSPDWLDSVAGQLINRLLSELIDALVVEVPATVYDFEAPCDVDANGDPVVLEQAIAAADYQPAIVARLDAIAAAMGILKGWKQPMCRTSPPRSNVTVTAYEFDPEA